MFFMESGVQSVCRDTTPVRGGSPHRRVAVGEYIRNYTHVRDSGKRTASGPPGSPVIVRREEEQETTSPSSDVRMCVYKSVYVYVYSFKALQTVYTK